MSQVAWSVGRTKSLEEGRTCVRALPCRRYPALDRQEETMKMFRSNERRLIVALVVAGLTLAGCGDQSAAPPVPETPADRSDFPVAVEAANGTIEIASRPDRIVSLSPTATEMLFAIDAGDQVVAVDDQSNFPAEAPKTDLSGFTPNIEAIAAEEPDLVVVANDIEDLVAGLAKLEIPTLLLPAAEKLSDSYDQISSLGSATGHVDDAETLVEEMKTEIGQLAASTPEPEEPLTYFHELDQTLFTLTSATFAGQVYELAGLRNIADAAPDAAGGYPQLSSEFIIDADPDFIFLADSKCCGQTAETVAARPGWSKIDAVSSDRVVTLDDDVASRWGPRVVEFLRTVVEGINRAGQPADQAA